MLKVLVITLEFIEPIFSGNGVYSRTIVRALATLPGRSSSILVLCGRDAATDQSNDWGQNGPAELPGANQSVMVHSVALPIWRKLDRASAWEQFAGAAAAEHADAIARFAPDVVLGVDWTGFPPLLELRRTGALRPPMAPFVYLNFRVHAASTGISAEDAKFYEQHESAALDAASVSVALCRADADLLRAMLSCAADQRKVGNVLVLSPPLRPDVQGAAAAVFEQEQSSVIVAAKDEPKAQCSSATAPIEPSTTPRREFVTCCSRLTPEKNVEAFVLALAAPPLRAIMRRRGLRPLLCGSATDPEYGKAVRTRLKQTFPGEESVVLDFVPAHELSNVFRRTALNVHPALYEAYGMTVAEAAAFGAPSIIDGGGEVGVAELLSATRNEVMHADMRDPGKIAERLAAVLEDNSALRHTAAAAQRRSLSWGIAEFGAKLSSILDRAMGVKDAAVHTGGSETK
eukprot:g1613.t1